MNLRIAFLCAMFLWIGNAKADQTDIRLDGLFSRLIEAQDPRAAAATEGEIWRIWLESGDEQVDQIMRAGIAAMTNGQVARSVDYFTQVVEIAPEFAEGWNKRATAHYLGGNLEQSMHDIHRTLQLEPRHFGAISGIGLIFMKTGDKRGALDAFEQVLEIYPLARGAGMQSKRLREMLEQETY